MPTPNTNMRGIPCGTQPFKLAAGDTTPGGPDSARLLEDGTNGRLLEDGTSDRLLEG